MLERFLEMEWWSQGFLVVGFPLVVLHFLRLIPAVDDWWEFGLPYRIGRKVNNFFYWIENIKDELFEKLNFRTPRISSKLMAIVGYLLLLALVAYIFVPDIYQNYREITLTKEGVETTGFVTSVEVFEDYADDENGNGGAYIEYFISFEYSHGQGILSQTHQTIGPFPNDDRRFINSEFPIPVKVKYLSSDPSLAYVVDYTDTENENLGFNLFFKVCFFLFLAWIIVRGLISSYRKSPSD
jgi:hypothetical protein